MAKGLVTRWGHPATSWGASSLQSSTARPQAVGAMGSATNFKEAERRSFLPHVGWTCRRVYPISILGFLPCAWHVLKAVVVQAGLETRAHPRCGPSLQWGEAWESEASEEP